MKSKNKSMGSIKKLPVESNTTVEEYNDIPVHYCTKCLSLKIMVYDEDTEYCDVCGNTEIAEAHIDEVIEMKKIKKLG